MPGLAPEEIDISVRGQSLAVRAHHKAAGTDRTNYLRREWGFGPFQRTIELAGPVDADRAEASFRHGVVTITLPKSDPNKARVIPLQDEAAPGAEETTEPETEITVDESPAEVSPPMEEPTLFEEQAETVAPPEPSAPAEAAPVGEGSTETAEVAGEEAPTRFYMRPPRRRGGQSRAAREAAKLAAAAEKPATDAPSAEEAPKPAAEPPESE